jgi:hypothetical protein
VRTCRLGGWVGSLASECICTWTHTLVVKYARTFQGYCTVRLLVRETTLSQVAFATKMFLRILDIFHTICLCFITSCSAAAGLTFGSSGYNSRTPACREALHIPISRHAPTSPLNEATTAHMLAGVSR